jgi:hypothetical protein
MGIEGSMINIETTNHTHSTYLLNNADSEPATDNTIDLGASDKRFANIHATTFNGTLNGNANTADQLSTSRNITLSGDVTGSASFNGTGDAAISATVVDDSHEHNTQYHTKLISDNRYARRDADTTPSNDNLFKLGDATHRWNEVHAVSFKGTADQANKLTNARSISLTGDATGTLNFDGSANASMEVTVIDGSHNHDSQYYTQAECNANFVSLIGDAMTGNLQFGDNNAIQMGNSQDFVFYHDGTNSIINNVTGNLSLQVNNGENALVAVPNSYTYLYYDNVWRARTTTLGLEVNGIFQGEATAARYADLAEILTCAENDVYPGTVMKFCEVGEFDVEECGTEFARNIAGVASANPAYLMNSEEQGVAVAYTGKVQVRVIGAVGKGQPIVPAGMGAARGIRKDSELLYSFGCTIEAKESDEENLVWCIVK